MVDSQDLRDVMVSAVVDAGRLAQGVREVLMPESSRTKDDRSPVTVADLAAQAVVRQRLSEHLPGVPVLGEEDASLLADPEFASRVVEAVHLSRPDMTLDDVRRGLEPDADATTAERRFVLDPIDGTKGYLRGDQYAVALGLIESGQVVAGVLGCPALGEGEDGVVMSAARGEGTWRGSLLARDHGWARIVVSSVADTARLRMVESVEAAHSAHDVAARVKADLGVEAEPVRIDSQCKYAVVASGEAEVYLRLPRGDYQEKVWDHAAGFICVEEAGGAVTDAQGAALDFSLGAHLSANRGIIATHGVLHDQVVAAVASAATA